MAYACPTHRDGSLTKPVSSPRYALASPDVTVTQVRKSAGFCPTRRDASVPTPESSLPYTTPAMPTLLTSEPATVVDSSCAEPENPPQLQLVSREQSRDGPAPPTKLLTEPLRQASQPSQVRQVPTLLQRRLTEPLSQASQASQVLQVQVTSRSLRRPLVPLRKVSQAPQVQVNSGSQRRLVPLRKVSQVPQAQVTSRSQRRLVSLCKVFQVPQVQATSRSQRRLVPLRKVSQVPQVQVTSRSQRKPVPLRKVSQVPQVQVTSPSLRRLVPLRKVSQVPQAQVTSRSLRRLVPLRKVSQVPQVQVTSLSLRRLVPLRKVSQVPQAQVTSRSQHWLVPLRKVSQVPQVQVTSHSQRKPVPLRKVSQVPQAQVTSRSLRRLVPLRKVSQVPQAQVTSRSQRRLVPLRKVSQVPQVQVTSRSLRRLVLLRKVSQVPQAQVSKVPQVQVTSLSQRRLVLLRKVSQVKVSHQRCNNSVHVVQPFLTTTVPAMLDSVFNPHEFGLGCLELEWGQLGHLHHTTLQALQDLECFLVQKPIHELALYTDGSYDPRTGIAAWAVCALARQAHGWCFVGFAANALPDEHKTEVGQQGLSHQAELYALAAALVLVGSVADIPASIGYDAKAAATIAQAIAWPKQSDRLSEALALLAHLATSRAPRLDWHHVSSHTGNPFNEFVDVAAKRAVQGKCRHPILQDHIVNVVLSTEFQWCWLHDNAIVPSHAVPPVDEAGTMRPIQGKPSSHPSLCTWPNLDRRRHVKPNLRCKTQKMPPVMTWQLRMATYNTLSLQSLAQRHTIATLFAQRDVHLIGLQECRYTPAEPRSRQGEYHVYAGPNDAGQFGCQLWVKADCPFAQSHTGEAVQFCPSQASILVAEPRLLVVLLDLGSMAMACVVGHGPTAAAGTEIVTAWWNRLDSCLRMIPRKFRPFLFLDGNARFQQGPAGGDTLAAQPQNLPATMLRETALRHSFGCSAQVDECPRPVVSWVGGKGKTGCIDYLLVPDSLRNGFKTEGSWGDFPTIHGPDHVPVVARVQWTDAALPTCSPMSIDRAAMLTPHGREEVVRIMQSAPCLPWTAHADDYLHELNSYLGTQLAASFPLHRQRPRQPSISDHTWSWIRHRRALRRQLHRIRSMQNLQRLRRCFQSWRRNRTERDHAERWSLLQARVGQMIRAATSQIRVQMRRDTAAHVRAAFAEARADGPEAVARLLRNTLRTGRSYRPLRVAPALEVDGQVVAGQSAVERTFAEYFAAAEKAQESTRAELDALPSAALGPVDADNTPSLMQLAGRFAMMKRNKATGISKIPAEAFRAAPIHAAALHFPLLLRMAVGREAPFLWSGGLSVPLPKPAKPLKELNGWRSVMLHEVACKAVGQTFRPLLVRHFLQLASEAQCGSQRSVPLALPMVHVRAHLQHLQAKGKSGAILFIDSKDAYYSVIRNFLFKDGAIRSQASLADMIQRVHPCPDKQRELAAALVGPGLLADAPPALVNYVKGTLTNAWFTTAADASILMSTATGTSPGAPLADALFQVIFTTVLDGLRSRLSNAGLDVLADDGSSAPHPTWADDVAVPLLSDRADEVPSAVQQAAVTAHEEMSKVGLHMNFDRGKSEAMLILRGPGSRRLRQRLLSPKKPFLPVTLQNGVQVQLALTQSYVHLGGLVTDDGKYMQDIDRRHALAAANFNAFRRAILYNSALTVIDKGQLFHCLVLTRYMHGMGQWILDKRAMARLRSHVYGWYRKMTRPLTGFSSRGLTDAEVCALTGLFPVEVHVTAARAMQLHTIATQGPGYLWSILQAAPEWLDAALNALREAACDTEAGIELPQARAEALHFLHGHLTWLRRLPAALKRQAGRKQAEARNSLVRKARDLCRLHDEGGGIFSLPAASGHSGFLCVVCGGLFSTRAALCSHLSRRHMHASSTAHIAGTRCAVCSMEFWTTPRLRLHLRKAPKCLTAHIEADLSFLSTEHKCEISLSRKPAVRTPGPTPFWACMRPAATPQEMPKPLDPLVFVWSVAVRHANDSTTCLKEIVEFLLLLPETVPAQEILEACPLTVLLNPTTAEKLASLVQLGTHIVAWRRRGGNAHFREGPFQVTCQGDRVMVTIA
ncbi:unnamed protein product [Symbiodinium natans]|uniref:RNase H type-1 domain-containing protein n=1 Tax=Symbiodinium natans TaxID=878477 RepID=A0A812SSS2_9DINO|nr:unnamed protein product [Symbiodinium natans]